MPEEISAIHALVKALVSRMHKELLQLNVKKEINCKFIPMGKIPDTNTSQKKI